MFVDLHLLLQRATTPFNLERIILLCFRMLEFESLLPFDLCVAKHTSLAFIIFRLRSQGKLIQLMKGLLRLQYVCRRSASLTGSTCFPFKLAERA